MLRNFKRITTSNLRLSLSLRLYSTTTQLSNSNNTEAVQLLTKAQLKNLALTQYSHGYFSNLLKNVVALLSVLRAASSKLIKTYNPLDSAESVQCSSVLNTLSKHFSVQEMGSELIENRFDVHSCCVRMSDKCESLVLPNLKLKVLIEAIRIVLQIVYDERFVTFFSYGGLVNMRRHTAVRYLKNSVKNPSWWFLVAFNRKNSDSHKVDMLCLSMGEKIKDTALFDLIKRLFDCETVRIELGGRFLGRGLPQECGLCPILINIYSDGFDRKLQEIQLRLTEKNLKFDKNEFGLVSNVCYKPMKVYAMRYLDEILVVTSGSKMFMMDLKNIVLKFLEEKLELNVDGVKTAVHSAVSEKIDFLGMELQAVAPLVLHPPLSEKAIRARNKYLRQKGIRAQELRNARERNGRKSGLKILSHVFKKLKQSGFKFEINLGNEVKDIFKTWADEVVQEFLGSLEERWTWHQMLSRGYLLSLGHIRDQLLEELVDACRCLQKIPRTSRQEFVTDQSYEGIGGTRKEGRSRRGTQICQVNGGGHQSLYTCRTCQEGG